MTKIVGNDKTQMNGADSKNYATAADASFYLESVTADQSGDSREME